MIKGIVFDLDHTLFDRYKTFEAVSYDFYNKLKGKIRVNREELYKIMCETDLSFNHLGWDRIDEYIERLGIFSQPHEKNEYSKTLFSFFNEYAVKFEFTIPLLAELRKSYKIALITNGPSERQRAKLRLLDLEDKFDYIYISGERGFEKPDLMPFKETAEALGLLPRELLYVGDHPVFDVDASRRAGYTPIWVKTIPDWQFDELEKAEYEVDTVEQLPEVLKEINKNTMHGC